MAAPYQEDLAYIHAVGFGGLARGAAPEIVRRLRGAAIPVHRVVDAGCGAGALSQALVEEGFAVTGIDSSAELLALAQKAVPAARFVQASLYDADLPPCEAVIALGEPLTYHPEGTAGEDCIRAFFRRVAEVLPAGGQLIFDVIERGQPSLTNRAWSAGEDWAALVESTEDSATHTLVRDIQTFRQVGESYRRRREVHRVHLFDIRSLCHQLRECGFSVETSQAYGIQRLGPRRRAFFATRIRRIRSIGRSAGREPAHRTGSGDTSVNNEGTESYIPRVLTERCHNFCIRLGYSCV